LSRKNSLTRLVRRSVRKDEKEKREVRPPIQSEKEEEAGQSSLSRGKASN